MKIRLLYIHRPQPDEDFEITDTRIISRLAGCSIIIFEGRQFNALGFRNGINFYQEHPYQDSVILRREDLES